MFKSFHSIGSAILVMMVSLAGVGCDSRDLTKPTVNIEPRQTPHDSSDKLELTSPEPPLPKSTDPVLDFLLDEPSGIPTDSAAATKGQSVNLDETGSSAALDAVDRADVVDSVDAAEMVHAEEFDEVEEEEEVDSAAADEPTIEVAKTWKRLGKHEIWIDFSNKQVILGGNICLRQGQLEMFVCPANTKEHESIIAVNALASEMHAALVALGADPGHPSQWDPEYKPASGPVIDINIIWQDPETGKKITRPAREMIQDFKTKETMTHDWVFGGSELWKDPETGEEVYYANSGEMICLSNFSTAALDLNVESSQSNDGLLFRAQTENIPPLGTKVYVVLKPGRRIGEENSEPKGEQRGEQKIEPKSE